MARRVYIRGMGLIRIPEMPPVHITPPTRPGGNTWWIPETNLVRDIVNRVVPPPHREEFWEWLVKAGWARKLEEIARREYVQTGRVTRTEAEVRRLYHVWRVKEEGASRARAEELVMRAVKEVVSATMRPPFLKWLKDKGYYAVLVRAATTVSYQELVGLVKKYYSRFTIWLSKQARRAARPAVRPRIPTPRTPPPRRYPPSWAKRGWPWARPRARVRLLAL